MRIPAGVPSPAPAHRRRVEPPCGRPAGPSRGLHTARVGGPSESALMHCAVSLGCSRRASPRASGRTPGTYRQGGASSLQRLFRTHFPEFAAVYHTRYARRLGHSRLQRITKAVKQDYQPRISIDFFPSVRYIRYRRSVCNIPSDPSRGVSGGAWAGTPRE
jgi:hypothetical protein